MTRILLPAWKRHDARSIGAALLLLLTTIPACGTSEYHHPVYPAGGSVTYKGKPVDDAVIVFHPSDPATIAIPSGKQGPEIARPTTRTDAEGKYALSTYYENDGAPAGEYRVTIAWRPETLAVSLKTKETVDGDPEVSPFKQSTGPKDKLAGKYADPSTSTLRASIKPDDPNQFTFALD